MILERCRQCGAMYAASGQTPPSLYCRYVGDPHDFATVRIDEKTGDMTYLDTEEPAKPIKWREWL